jgi:hypothetical protein
MSNIDKILQALVENKKLVVPKKVTVYILARIEEIELHHREENDGRFQDSLCNHDEE